MKHKIIIGIELFIFLALLAFGVIYGQVLLGRIFTQTENVSDTLGQEEVTQQVSSKEEKPTLSAAEKMEMLTKLQSATTDPEIKRQLLKETATQNTAPISPEEKLKLLESL